MNRKSPLAKWFHHLRCAVQTWLAPCRRRQTLGACGERLAARFLKKQKMVIVRRSQRIGRGEIDLIAVEGETVVFVEVKTRRSHVAGHPAEAVDDEKQRQLTRLALQFLKKHHLLEYNWRFDIVAITWPKGARPTIEHYRAAFEPPPLNTMFV